MGLILSGINLAEILLQCWPSPVPSALGSYLYKLVALLAGDDEIIPELVLRLRILDDSELV